MSHNSYGMFSFSFFGHGGKNDKIYGIDWMPVNLEEIYHLLGPAEFPGLAGKPKVLIFNACRRSMSKYNMIVICMQIYIKLTETLSLAEFSK